MNLANVIFCAMNHKNNGFWGAQNSVIFISTGRVHILTHTLKRTHGLGFYWDVHTLFLFNKLELQFHLTIYGWVDSHFNYHLFDRAFSYRFFGSASDAMAYGILLQSHAAIFKDLYFPLEVIIIVRWLQLL